MKIIASIFSDNNNVRAQNAAMQAAANAQLSRRQLNILLQMYYFNNGLYEQVQRFLSQQNTPIAAIKGLRNPAYRTVEFYPSNVWPGSLMDPATLTIITEKPNDKPLIEGIQTVWERSNWGESKELFVRWLANFGDSFIKVSQNDKKQSFYQVINPIYVTSFNTDYKNDVIAIRMDIPQEDEFLDENILLSNVTPVNTEWWDLASDSIRLWIGHKFGIDAKIKDLGEPTRTMSISRDVGIDFLPFVHSRFNNVGETAGLGAFTLAIDKIDEVNRQATRFHQIMFRNNRPIMAISSNTLDREGRPVPAPKIGRIDNKGNNVVDMEGEKLVELPGNATLSSLVPNINFDAHLAALNAQLDDLRTDLPELNYYELNDNSGANARAAFFRMSPALQRLRHVRGVAETALVKADRMALYLDGLYGIKDAIRYESIDDKKMKHWFEQRPYMQLSGIDQQEENLARMNVLNAKKELGVDTKTILIEAGYDEADIEEMIANKQKELLAMQATFAAGNGQMPSRQEQNGQSPTFNETGNDASNPDDKSPIQQNGKARTVRGIEG